jgi:sirohydrochlorin cobaltochelatase
MNRALILFAHGARDPAWRKPLDELAAAVRGRTTRSGDGGGDLGVEIAFLELMAPDLPTTIDALVARGARRIAVLPVFWSRGGPVAHDLPPLLDAARARHAGIEFTTLPTLSELPGLLEFVAAIAIEQAR